MEIEKMKREINALRYILEMNHSTVKICKFLRELKNNTEKILNIV